MKSDLVLASSVLFILGCASHAPKPSEAGGQSGSQAPVKTPTEEEMRTCDSVDDCVPVGCSCECSGCGGFSSEDIVNRKYEDLWYEIHACEKEKVCLEVCCPDRALVCENGLCGSTTGP
jgi:hypothetical protein